MPKSYRIRTEVGVDKHIDVKLEQDFDFLEILSLKINQSDIYIRPCSDYGVIVGRISVNNGFGVPNAKVSVFIPLSNEDEQNPVISDLYPYKSLSDLNEDGYRYNLLPKEPSYSVHAATGTFPTRSETLIDQTQIEIYDKYYKFTVKTNESGDYMIFGVPIGSQTVFMDVDLSDIGCFSLSPQDLIQQGLATDSQVNGSQFKKSTNLNELPQIVTANRIIDVSPLWGEPDICSLGITRCDFDLTQNNNINIQPTAIFMGSVVSTTDDDALKKNCKPKNNTGNLCELVSGPGQIQAIRQTVLLDNQNLPLLEEYQFEQNGNVIDGDGSYLVNVPMNLNYIVTNEFGQQVISNDPTKGIPTKGKYRFKFKWNNEGGLQSQFLRANFLVPNIKEYGWTTSSSDPLVNATSTPFIYTLPVGVINGTPIAVPGDGWLVLENKSNVNDFNIYLNGVLYTGDPQIIPITVGTISIIANPTDPNLQQTLTFSYFPTGYFDLLKSYSFSLDWDDYNDVSAAINCEDTFYEFNYNKVYTTSMFLDRYKNGLGRARHLGIKEIDNRTCKSTVNTFPVNDIIRNFDFIFFVFNVLINVLAFPMLVLLFIAHFISFIWPILKYLLIIFGIYLSYNSGVALYEVATTGWQQLNNSAGIVSSGAGFVVNVTNILEILRLSLLFGFQVLKAVFMVALSLTFTAFAAASASLVKGFPRISLPMISYPECNNCECKCGNAEQDDDFDANSVQADIDSNKNNSNLSNYSQSNSFLAPLNISGTYNKVQHPNLENRPGYDANTNKGWFNDNSGNPDTVNYNYYSLLKVTADFDMSTNVVTQSVIDLRRLFSGWDIDEGFDAKKQKAPQPFLFSADKESGTNDDKRWFGRPQTESYPQKLNEFNTRDKFFSGINKIRTTVNPTLGSDYYDDNVIAILANVGTTSQIGVGELVTFQNTKSSNGQINLTGSTLNQFGTNAITGTSLSNPTTQFGVSVPHSSGVAMVNIINSGGTENYMQYLPDIEYFQIVTGMTIGQFETYSDLTATGLFPKDYLKHIIYYKVEPDNNVGNFVPPPPIIKTEGKDGNVYDKQANYWTAIEQIENYDTQIEVIILVRGVDPYTEKQTITYDLSRIFGHTFNSNVVTIKGSYYMNIPIQVGTTQPKSHNTLNNDTPTGVYFPSYTFTPSTDYTGFTSYNPYYYLSTDDTSLNVYTNGGTNYTSVTGAQPLSSYGTLNTTSNTHLQLAVNDSNFIGGGAFIGFESFIPSPENSTWYYSNCWTEDSYGYPTYGLACPGTELNYTLYSEAYYRFTNPSELIGVEFSNKDNIVMRSDRLPTSDCVENNTLGPRTGYALQQNNNFCYYKQGGLTPDPRQGVSADLPSGESFDSGLSGLTQTLNCENMVSLYCYSGSGTDVGVIPDGNCFRTKNNGKKIPIGTKRVVNGCYCLLNKSYLAEYGNDAALFLEWKTRFTITFAACRGVFAQVFQNNWINGVLYMFNFNKGAEYSSLTDTKPEYTYCKDVIVFNKLENNFYYRSSPWDGTNFIGKDAPSVPSSWPTTLVSDYPGIGYNKKQIQFPTTIMDMGPRESFISEICNNSNFNGYLVDQIKSTSYQDNSDLIQVGFLSRLLNDNFRQSMLPISSPSGDNTEGKGIIQFFNSNRQGDRIDGDFAQMLSINSEWRISPFLSENYPNPDSIFFGNDSQTQQRPVFGVFFETDNIDYTYRRKLSPGINYYNLTPTLYYQFGYPKTQNVPHYKWKLDIQSNYIFGNENNNWDTDTTPNAGFFSKGYQNLDFNSDPYFQSSFNGSKQGGYITNLSGATAPDPTTTNTTPVGSSILVGAPYHFYFGLNNGKTAIDKFVKLYINNPDA